MKPTHMMIQLANHSIKFPFGIVENMLVRVGRFTILVDFVIVDIKEDIVVPLILGRPFMNTTNVIISVMEGKCTLRVDDEGKCTNVVITYLGIKVLASSP